MVLGGMLHGIERKLDPGPAGRQCLPRQHADDPAQLAGGARAPSSAATSPGTASGERFARLYAQTRRGEMQDFSSYVSPLEYAWYLTTT